MKTAKEMFEEMGFHVLTSSKVVYYEEPNENFFEFNLRNKEIECVCKFELYKKHEKEINEAIYKQCEELGWLDEE